MKLIIRRDQDVGLLGGISFVLTARVELTSEEEALIKKYKAHRAVLFVGSNGNREYTIEHLVTGVRDKCKDISVLLANEELYKEVAARFKIFLEVMQSFGGEEVIEF